MSLFRVPVPAVVGRTALVVSVGLLVTGAWLALWLAEESVHGFLHHHGFLRTVSPSAAFVLLFMGGWTVMTVAMMLPTSLPILTTLHSITGQRRDCSLLLGLTILGYLLSWAVFGAIVYAAALGLGRLLVALPQLDLYAWAGAPALLLLAGLFQFSSLKYRCLEKCRSPFSFVIEHWQGRRPRWQAFRLGVDHGAFCVGCCWALMLLMFIVGIGSVAWMLVLAAVMAVEKNVPWGRRMSAPVGVVLIACAVALVVAR